MTESEEFAQIVYQAPLASRPVDARVVAERSTVIVIVRELLNEHADHTGIDGKGWAVDYVGNPYLTDSFSAEVAARFAARIAGTGIVSVTDVDDGIGDGENALVVEIVTNREPGEARDQWYGRIGQRIFSAWSDGTIPGGRDYLLSES